MGGGFLGAPAACWWARTDVESTLTFQSRSLSASAAAWTCWRSLSQVPSADHSKCRLWTVFHGPKRSGSSRHCTPVLSR